jgi:hypothetical protein
LGGAQSPIICARHDPNLSLGVEELLPPGWCLGFGVVRSNHHEGNLAILEAFARQAIPSHFLDPIPVLAEIARSLLLRLKFCLQATSVARITVCNLKKDCLLSFFEVLFGWQGMTHRLFLRERLIGPSCWG